MNPHSYCRCDPTIPLVCAWCRAEADQAQARKDRETKRTPIPPHAAGEEDNDRLHIRHIAFWLRATVDQFESEQSITTALGSCQRNCIRWAAEHYEALAISPVASQAAPETVANGIARARELPGWGLFSSTIIWLADRVTELERELNENV